MLQRTVSCSVLHHRHMLAGVLVLLVSWLTADMAAAQTTRTQYLDADLGQNLEALGRLYESISEGKLKSGGQIIVGEVSGTPVPVEVEIIKITQVFSTQQLQPANPPNIQGGGTNLNSTGTCVVGYQDNGTSTPYHAFRWLLEGASLDLGTLDPANNGSRTSFGTDTNQDCSIVVGYSQVVAGTTEHAFRWTQANGMQDLNSLASATGPSRAYGVSSNGNVIVGEAEFPAGAFQRKGAFRVDGWLVHGSHSGNRTLAGHGSLGRWNGRRRTGWNVHIIDCLPMGHSKCNRPADHATDRSPPRTHDRGSHRRERQRQDCRGDLQFHVSPVSRCRSGMESGNRVSLGRIREQRWNQGSEGSAHRQRRQYDWYHVAVRHRHVAGRSMDTGPSAGADR